MTEKNEAEETRIWIRRMLQDPVTQLLQEHSHLTQVQLETLLIDYLTDGFSGRRLDYETKAALRKHRAKKKGVTRGAFNRSLAQARKNIIKSIFTLVLLGYLGLFETPSLTRYVSLAEAIRSYAKDYDQAIAGGVTPTTTHIRALKLERKRILDLIAQLAHPLALKPE